MDNALIGRATQTLLGCYRAFVDYDASMLEINPLVVTRRGDLVALDAKMSFDENALFRRPHISEMRDKSQEDPRETFASDRGLSYVGLDGGIGCIINGAGLAMATMDMIKIAGGKPANFLDIGGGASPERVAKSFRAVLRDKNVETILVNIFAGINRCDRVAAGVIKALREVGVPVPLVVRLSGTNMEEGRRILAEAGENVIIAERWPKLPTRRSVHGVRSPPARLLEGVPTSCPFYSTRIPASSCRALPARSAASTPRT